MDPTTTNTTTSKQPSQSLTPSTLCNACKSIFDLSNPTTLPSTTTSSPQQSRPSTTSSSLNGTLPTATSSSVKQIPHHDLGALAIRATRGCHLCLTVYMAIDPDAFRTFRNKSNSLGYAAVVPIGRDQAKLRFWYVGAGEGGDGGIGVSGNGNGGSKSEDGDRVGSPLVVELMLVNPRYAVEPGVRTLPSQAVSTGSDESFEAAKDWLHECSFNHMKCSVSDGSAVWKPTHLLDVSVRGPKGVQGVKLVDGMFLDPFTEYVTLSHCWGKGRTIRLSKKTLPSLRQGVAASNLPKTLADAVETTEKLGFRYLWIDALCIMHDDEQAVLTEIAQMHKVYSEASLNLAATSSREDGGGLFCSRNIDALRPPVVEVRGQGIADGVYKCLRSTVWRDLVDSSPLSKRAWVFQERCLAKRTLHFTRNELLWECQQMNCSEVFPNGLPADLTSQSSSEKSQTGTFNKKYFHQRTGNWNDLVQMYSRGRLSYSTDKLLAIAGLARQYMTRNRLRESDYIAGLWRPALPHALLWRIEDGRAPTKYRAPTWSWASLDGRVSYSETLAHAGSKETCVEILDVQLIQAPIRPSTTTTTNGSPDTGQPKQQPSSALNGPSDRAFSMLLEQGTAIKLRGFLVRGLLRRTHDYWGRTPCVIQCPARTALPHQQQSTSSNDSSSQPPNTNSTISPLSPASQPQPNFSNQPVTIPATQLELTTSYFDTRLPPLSSPYQSNLTETLEIYLLPVLDSIDSISGLILTAYVPPVVAGSAVKHRSVAPGLALANGGANSSNPNLPASVGVKEKRKGEYRRIGTFEISRYDQVNWERFKRGLKGEDGGLAEGRGRWEERLEHRNGYWFASDFTYTIWLV